MKQIITWDTNYDIKPCGVQEGVIQVFIYLVCRGDQNRHRHEGTDGVCSVYSFFGRYSGEAEEDRKGMFLCGNSTLNCLLFTPLPAHVAKMILIHLTFLVGVCEKKKKKKKKKKKTFLNF